MRTGKRQWENTALQREGPSPVPDFGGCGTRDQPPAVSASVSKPSRTSSVPARSTALAVFHTPIPRLAQVAVHTALYVQIKSTRMGCDCVSAMHIRQDSAWEPQIQSVGKSASRVRAGPAVHYAGDWPDGTPHPKWPISVTTADDSAEPQRREKKGKEANASLPAATLYVLVLVSLSKFILLSSPCRFVASYSMKEVASCLRAFLQLQPLAHRTVPPFSERDGSDMHTDWSRPPGLETGCVSGSSRPPEPACA